MSQAVSCTIFCDKRFISSRSTASKPDFSSTWIEVPSSFLFRVTAGESVFINVLTRWYRWTYHHEPFILASKPAHLSLLLHPQLHWSGGQSCLRHSLLSSGRTHCVLEVLVHTYCFQIEVPKDTITLIETVGWCFSFFNKTKWKPVRLETYCSVTWDGTFLSRDTYVMIL